MPVTNIDITDVDHEARITANEDSITSLNSSISSLSSAVNNPTTGLSALNTTVSGHTTSIGTINTTLSSHTSSIATLTSNYGTLTTAVSGHTTSIGTLTSDVSTLSSTVSGHTTSISNINTSISGITTDISNIQTSLENVSLNTTGFENQVDSTYSFDEGTRTFTIQPAITDYSIFQDGIKNTITISKSIQIPDVTSPYFIYFDDNVDLQYLSSFDISLIQNKVYVAVIYWNADQNKTLFVGNERHESVMSWATHYYLHTYEGSRYRSGFALSNFNIDGDGSLDSHSQFSSEAGVFSDEDIIHIMSSLSQIPVLYRLGTVWRKKTADDFPFIGEGQEGFTGSGRACYNQLVMSSYQLTEVSNNHHFLVHLFATNDVDYPVIAILGTNEYAPVADAREGANTEISTLTGLPFTEFIIIGTVILKTSDSYTNTYKVATVTTDLGENFVDFRTSTVLNISSGAGDHSLLSNLDKDTHLHYLNETRGNLLYPTLAQFATKQDLNSNLTALSGLATNGITVKTGSGIFVTRSLTGTSNRIVITNGDGVSGNPTFDIGTDVVTLNGTQVLTNKSISASQIDSGNLNLQRLPLLAKGDLITSDDGSTNILKAIDTIDKKILSTVTDVGGNKLAYRTIGDLILPDRETVLYDDFMGSTNAGTTNWIAVTNGVNSGVTIATQPIIDSKHNGVMSLSTGTNNSGRCTYHNGLTNFIFGNVGNINSDSIIKVPVLSDVAQEYSIEIGLGDNTGATADQTNGIYFKYDRTISVNWIIVCSNAGVRTSTTTSIAVQTTNWNKLSIITNPVTATCYFYVDSVLAGSINTNIPTPTTAIMGYLFKIRKTAGTTARLLNVDSAYIWHYRDSVNYGA